MPIEFRCVSCGKLLRTGDGTADQQAKCPECEAIQTIPTPEMLSGEAPVAGPAPFEPLPGDFPRTDQAGADAFGAPGQFPTSGAPPMDTASVVPAELRAYALRKVAVPGMALIVLGGLGVLLGIFAVVTGVSMMNGTMPPIPDPQLANLLEEVRAGLGVINIVMVVLGIGVAILMVVGGIKMRRLESRGLCITAAVLAIVPTITTAILPTIPCITPCCCLEIPVGIWALVVLLDRQVAAAFCVRSAAVGQGLP